MASLFEKCGYDRTFIDERVSHVWYEIFEGPHKIYWQAGNGLGYVVDTGNDDVRTEGMSYAMMLAVQYDRKDVFDRLWGWAMKYMYMDFGPHAHYFAWSVGMDGTPHSQGPAPDGEEYFAMDLILASRRWGNGEDIYDYGSCARELLSHCLHNGQQYLGLPMWNQDNALIKFIPEVEWSDPSYHLPHYYEVFAQEANAEDHGFWLRAARASRKYLLRACNPNTGMSPEYADYDGSAHVDERDHWHFFSDAYRTAANIGLDTSWIGAVPELCDRVAALQDFFLKHDRTCVYSIDGAPVDMVVLHPVGFLAATAQGSLASLHSLRQDATPNALTWARMLWNTPMRTGRRRYYDNFLYAFAVLALSGKYRYEW